MKQVKKEEQMKTQENNKKINDWKVRVLEEHNHMKYRCYKSSGITIGWTQWTTGAVFGFHDHD